MLMGHPVQLLLINKGESSQMSILLAGANGIIGFFLYNFKNGFQKNHLNKLETQVPEIGAHFLT